MDFNFGSEEKEKKNDKDESDILKDSEDITVKFTEAECRALLNRIGRAAAYMFIAASTVADNLSDDGEVSSISHLNFKSRMRHAIAYLGPMCGEKEHKDLAVFPIYRI